MFVLTVGFTAVMLKTRWSHSRYSEDINVKGNCLNVMQATVGSHQRFYIAAQGPLPSTVGSFWQMIWEADVYLVVMLTSTHEEGSTVYCPGLGDRCIEVGEVGVIGWSHGSSDVM